jgi:hypothetical protein
VRGVLGGEKPPDVPTRIGKRGLDRVEAKKYNAVSIIGSSRRVPLFAAPTMARGPIRPWSLAPHGSLVFLERRLRA